MKTYVIWKQKLPTDCGPFTILLPEGCELLTPQVQANKPVLWAKFEAPWIKRVNHVIVCTWTGRQFDMEHTGRYLGTCVMDDGTLVCHYFYEGIR